MTNLLWTPDVPNNGGWKTRHLAAINAPQGSETPIVTLLSGWLQYAKVYKQRYESTIGEDYVLGPAWQDTGKALLIMLNGECGRLDCGTLDSLIRMTFTANGYDEEGEVQS